MQDVHAVFSNILGIKISKEKKTCWKEKLHRFLLENINSRGDKEQNYANTEL